MGSFDELGGSRHLFSEERTMARFLSNLVCFALGCTVLVVSPAMAQQPDQPRAPVRDLGESETGKVLREILGSTAPKLDSAELAGMPAGATPPALTLEQAYTLTLIRARTPNALRTLGAAKVFDAKALDELAKRADTGDFERFRREFLAADFRDPAPRFFAAIKHRLALGSARDQVALAENIRRLFAELISSEASGVSRLQVDLMDQSVLLFRQTSAIELAGYRSSADVLKGSLGLPLATPLVMDENSLRPFTTVFIAIDAWQRNPNRQLEELTAMHDRLPRLEDLKIGGRSLLEVVQGTLREEEFLASCLEVARKHRPMLDDASAAPDDRNARELRIRRLVRSLILIQKNYEIGRKRLELAFRVVDHWIEQMTSPFFGTKTDFRQQANAVLQAPSVMQSQSRLDDGRNEFVSLWLDFKEQSSALYRELGMMPYDDWQAFHRSFVPEAGRPPVQGEPRAGSQTPSAPPAPKIGGE
jgi:hypothetical protein